jgi:hypothetical protein
MDHNKNIRNMSVIAHVDHVSISRNGDATRTRSMRLARDWARVGVENPAAVCVYSMGWIEEKYPLARRRPYAWGLERFGIYSRRNTRNVDGADCD